MNIPAKIALWLLLVSPTTFDRIPAPTAIDERRAIEVAGKTSVVREAFSRPTYRAKEGTFQWRVHVRNEGVPAFGSDRIILIDKRTGEVRRVVYGK